MIDMSNWKIITKTFQQEIRKCFEEPLEFTILGIELAEAEKYLKDAEKNRKELEEIMDVIYYIPKVFNERRVKRIIEVYNSSIIGLGKLSLSELAKIYIGTLKRMNTNRFKRFGSDITRIKELFNKLDIMDMEENLFMTVESELK